MSKAAYRVKIVVGGACRVGKSCYARRLCTGEFKSTYAPTAGVVVSCLDLQTTAGEVRVALWDISGAASASLRESYLSETDGAVLLFDACALRTQKAVGDWRESLEKTCPDVPVVVCGTKIDKAQCKALPSATQLVKLSSKSACGLHKPLLSLLSTILGYSFFCRSR